MPFSALFVFRSAGSGENPWMLAIGVTNLGKKETKHHGKRRCSNLGGEHRIDEKYVLQPAVAHRGTSERNAISRYTWTDTLFGNIKACF